MKIYNTKKGIIINHNEQFFLSKETNWDAFVNREQLFKKVSGELSDLKHDNTLAEAIESDTLAPIFGQEVWASGVTYFRSRTARIEESKDACRRLYCPMN
ncbi:hypothetical protein [Mucilaginibacter sp.]|uniref:hypothetical protein n=1 Tax=Mucilaginibacter sp. TaxID=1882438 RepID=UPI0026365305|nr:hypothetical protein [Mucilaginibacter sp.]MDB4925840.1 fumarylacetoacetate hydrolase [Mucilaginibacter sp.]